MFILVANDLSKDSPVFVITRFSASDDTAVNPNVTAAAESPVITFAVVATVAVKEMVSFVV